MSPQELRKVTAWEMRLMRDAAKGLTYAEIAQLRGKTAKAIEKSFERLRDKLRDRGGAANHELGHNIGLGHSYAYGVMKQGSTSVPTWPTSDDECGVNTRYPSLGWPVGWWC